MVRVTTTWGTWLQHWLRVPPTTHRVKPPVAIQAPYTSASPSSLPSPLVYPCITPVHYSIPRLPSIWEVYEAASIFNSSKSIAGPLFSVLHQCYPLSQLLATYGYLSTWMMVMACPNVCTPEFIDVCVFVRIECSQDLKGLLILPKFLNFLY